MHKIIPLLLSIFIVLSLGCSPVKLPVTDQYQLSAYSTKKMAPKPRGITLQVTAPEAAAGYQTNQMLYIKKPYELGVFAKNSWTSPPADMLYPLLIQSLQRSGSFYAVTTASYVEEADYRLDTQLLFLQQNFLKKPSMLEFSAKVVLTSIDGNHVVGSKIISLQIPCSSDTPYGGVLAANKATQLFTANVTEFVISHTK